MTDFTHDEENVTAILNGWWNQYFKNSYCIHENGRRTVSRTRLLLSLIINSASTHLQWEQPKVSICSVLFAMFGLLYFRTVDITHPCRGCFGPRSHASLWSRVTARPGTMPGVARSNDFPSIHKDPTKEVAEWRQWDPVHVSGRDPAHNVSGETVPSVPPSG